MPSPTFPGIYQRWGNESEILSGIKNGQFFGFIVADVTTPPEVFEKISHLNFPPIIQRGKIDEPQISEYMLGRCRARGKKLPQETLVQTYNATQLLIYSPTVQFYMDLGLQVSNVTKFIQFLPTRPLEDFVKKITEGRISAVKDGNESLGCAYKVIGNS